jgi:hypothetical protein
MEYRRGFYNLDIKEHNKGLTVCGKGYAYARKRGKD